MTLSVVYSRELQSHMSSAALVRDWVLMQDLMAFKNLNLLTQTRTHTHYIPSPFSDLVRLLFLWLTQHTFYAVIQLRLRGQPMSPKHHL